MTNIINTPANRLLFLLLLGCWVLPAAAEDFARVELLIFQHEPVSAQTVAALSQAQGNPTARSFLAIKSSTYWAALGGGDEGHARPLFSTTRMTEFIPVEQNRLLDEAKTKLEGSSYYDVLYHVAWRQPLLALEKAVELSLLKKNRQQNLLAANVKLSFSGYFRLQLELLYKVSQLAAGALAEESVIAINVNEVMESGALYYFDHQLIGVLAIIEKSEG